VETNAWFRRRVLEKAENINDVNMKNQNIKHDISNGKGASNKYDYVQWLAVAIIVDLELDWNFSSKTWGNLLPHGFFF